MNDCGLTPHLQYCSHIMAKVKSATRAGTGIERHSAPNRKRKTKHRLYRHTSQIHPDAQHIACHINLYLYSYQITSSELCVHLKVPFPWQDLLSISRKLKSDGINYSKYIQ